MFKLSKKQYYLLLGLSIAGSIAMIVTGIFADQLNDAFYTGAFL